MRFIPSFGALELDIVGIVAILGEGATSRNAQASSLSWWHLLPRLYPAPQALLRPSGEEKLPTELGCVIGAHSGRIRNELNFFTQVLHPKELEPYSVELVEVKRKEHDDDKTRPTFSASKKGHMAALSFLGWIMSGILIALSAWRDDGPALTATILLSATSSFAGLASYSRIDDSEEIIDQKNKGKTPLSDIIIFYPKTGALRVVRCDEETNRLYFRVETCKRYLRDTLYRYVAFTATGTLMAGLIMLGNSTPPMQAAFAASYVLLNGLYWASSALNPLIHVWEHDFHITQISFTKQMIRTRSGKIKPDYSELSPEESKFGHALADKSPDYYHNRDWKLRKGARVPTTAIFDLENDGNIIVAPIARPRPTLLQSVISVMGWSKPVPAGNAFELSARAQSPGPSFPTKLLAILGPRASSAERPVTRKLTSALWTAIALTGSARWARTSNIAPNTEAWDQWLKEAEEVALVRWSRRHKTYVPPCLKWKDAQNNTCIQLPRWEYGKRLGAIFKAQDEVTKKRFEWTVGVEDAQIAFENRLSAVIALRILVRRFRARRQVLLQSQSRSSLSGNSTS